MGKITNNKKTLKFILTGLTTVVVAFAIVCFTMSITGEDSEVSAYSSTDVTESKAIVIDDSKEYAKKLYDCKVEDVSDTAAVATLLETMDMESVTGEYNVTIAPKDGKEILTLSVKEPVNSADKKYLDLNMEKYSQQLMALVTPIDKVKWSYSIKSADAEEENVIVSLDVKDASNQLSKDVKEYGRSVGDFQKLLTVQAGNHK